MSLQLPRNVYEAVGKHLRSVGRRAHRDWEINQAHEDSLTGALFSQLATHRTRRISVDRGEWLWRIKAYKFGSGGRGSQEKLIGADGILEVEIWHHGSGTIDHKSILIQAKKQWAGRDARLVKQINSIESIASGSSVAFDYGPDGYSAVRGQHVLTAEGYKYQLSGHQIEPLGDFLADQFLACTAGVKGLYYDPRRKLLHPPVQPTGPSAIEFIVPERLRIEIEEMSGNE
jgi:hypothetical protein